MVVDKGYENVNQHINIYKVQQCKLTYKYKGCKLMKECLYQNKNIDLCYDQVITHPNNMYKVCKKLKSKNCKKLKECLIKNFDYSNNCLKVTKNE